MERCVVQPKTSFTFTIICYRSCFPLFVAKKKLKWTKSKDISKNATEWCKGQETISIRLENEMNHKPAD